LRCNDPPLDAELSELQFFRVQSPEILSELDKEMARAPDMLDHFIRVRERVESHLRDIEVVVHPIRRVPTEILHEVFLHCRQRIWLRARVELLDGYDSMHPGHPPWTLSRVCGRWRTISLSFPRLW
ncbi:hypothetical protein BDZ89DRAFT_926724, partial [Hymenopellis radicata]